MTRREAQAVVESALAVISEVLCSGGSVYLRGFGCFEARSAGSRRARDPRGDGIIEIPPKVRPSFRPYDRLRESVSSALSRMTRVPFVYAGAPGASAVSVVGSFNGWDSSANPMQRLPDGSWVAEVPLPAGAIVSYRFWVDGALLCDPRTPSDGRGDSVRTV